MLVSTGAIVPFSGPSVPSGFLLCDGSAVSRTTYAALYSVIGTTYGSGDGSTTFNLPDLRGRIVAQPNYILNYIIATQDGTTGSGAIVLADSPTLTAPVLGTASASSLTFSTAAGIIGTTTNDDAAAGSVGEYRSAIAQNPSLTSPVTITIASPAVVSWTGHGLGIGNPVVFTTTGALPTGITAGTVYYVSSAGLTTNSFRVSTTVSNALSGTSVNTSGSQSGTHTATSGVPLGSGSVADVQGLSLTAGDWDVRGTVGFRTGTSTSITFLAGGISLTSGALGPTVDDSQASFFLRFAAEVPASNSNQHHPIATGRLSLAATTTVYLVARADFTVSTMKSYGWISARRVR